MVKTEANSSTRMDATGTGVAAPATGIGVEARPTGIGGEAPPTGIDGEVPAGSATNGGADDHGDADGEGAD